MDLLVVQDKHKIHFASPTSSPKMPPLPLVGWHSLGKKMIVEFLNNGAIQSVNLDIHRREKEWEVETDPQSETFECSCVHSLHETGNSSVSQEPTSDWTVGSIYRSERWLPTCSYS